MNFIIGLLGSAEEAEEEHRLSSNGAASGPPSSRTSGGTGRIISMPTGTASLESKNEPKEIGSPQEVPNGVSADSSKPQRMTSAAPHPAPEVFYRRQDKKLTEAGLRVQLAGDNPQASKKRSRGESTTDRRQEESKNVFGGHTNLEVLGEFVRLEPALLEDDANG